MPMLADEIAFVLPAGSWLFLLQCRGVKDAWMLPTGTAQKDLNGGRDWLAGQGLLWFNEKQTAIDEVLDQVACRIAKARWGLDIRVDNHLFLLLNLPEGWIWLRVLSGGRLSVQVIDSPIEKIKSVLHNDKGAFGIRSQGSPLWIAEMNGNQLEQWFRENECQSRKPGSKD